MRTTLPSFFKKVLLGVLLITASNIILAQPTWTRVDYTSSTAFVGWVRINFYDASFPVTVEAGDYIGAFVDGECRMIAEVFTYNGELYVSSVIHGGDAFDGYPSDDPNITSTAEEVEYKVWDISANSEIATQVMGTMDSNPGGEILDYEIGKPNTNSELESLEITGVTITPTFATATTTYTVTLPAGSTLPAVTDYITSLVDSRATVDVDEATDFTTNNITTVTVTAEDGSTTEYTITFSEEQCTVLAPTVDTPLEYCVGGYAPQLTANGVDLTWYSTETSDDGTATAPIPSTDMSGSTSYWVSQTDGCESDRAEIQVVVNDTAAPVVTIDQTDLCEGDVAQLSVTGGTFSSYSWSGSGQAYLSATNVANPTFSGDVAGQYSSLGVTVVNEFGCNGYAMAPIITVNPTPTATLTPDASDICEGDGIQITATTSETGTGTWSSTPAGAVSKVDDNTADFIGSSSGQYEISYTFTSNNGCVLEQPATTTITVNPIPEAEIVASSLEYCGSLSDVELTLQSVAVDLTGATFDLYQDGTLLTDNGTGTSLINFAPAGEYYAVVTLNSCQYITPTVTVVENPLPTVSITPSRVDACESGNNSGVINITPSGTAATGTLVYSSATATIDATTGALDPTVNTVGVHTIELTYEDANGCINTATTDVEVHALPTVIFGTNPDELCYNTAAIDLDVSPNPTTATSYSFTGTTSPTSANFDPAAVSPGTQNFTYTYKDTYECENSATETLDVIMVEPPTVDAPNPKTVVKLSGGGLSTDTDVSATESFIGDNLEWMPEGGGSIIETGNTYVTGLDDATAEGVYNFAVREIRTLSTGAMCYSDSVIASVIITQCPALTPEGSNPYYCVGSPDPVTATVSAAPGSTGEKISWFSFDPVGQFGAGAADITDDNLTYTSALTTAAATTEVVYAAEYDLANDCWSAGLPVTINIVENPVVTLTPPTDICATDGVLNIPVTPASGILSQTTAVSGFDGSAKTWDPSGQTAVSVTLDLEYLVETTHGSGVGQTTCSTTETASVTSHFMETPTPEPKYWLINNIAGIPDDFMTASTSGTGTDITWYDTPTKDNIIISTATFTMTPDRTGLEAEVVAAGNPDTYVKSYWITQTNAQGCESEPVEVTLTLVDCPFLAPEVVGEEQCVGTPLSDISASVPATTNEPVDEWKWYDDAMNPIVNNSDTYAHGVDNSVAGTTTYNVSYIATETISGNQCESQTMEVAVVVNPLPTVTFSTDAVNNELCMGDELALSVAPAGGVLEVDGVEVAFADLSNAIADVGEYTLTYTVTNANGCVNSETIVLSVVDCACQVGAPEVADVDYCEGDDAVALTATTTTATATLNWYDAQQNPLASAPVPATDQVGTTQYFVSQTDGCEGLQAAINVTVKSKPSAPITEDVAYCDGDVIADLTATGDAGATLNWYDDAMNPIADITSPAAGTYNVSQTVNGCVSDTAQLSIHVFSIPDAPDVADVETCEGTSSSIDASVVSQWYLTETDETPVATDASYTPTVTNPDTYTYYVAQTVNSCQSEKVPVTYTIVPNPTLTFNNEVAEFGTTIPDLSVTTDPANTVNWYTTDEPAEFIQSGTDYATGETAIGTYYYQVEAVNGNCSSGLQTISLEITDCMLAQPIVNASSNEICFGDDNPIFSVTNASETVIWYTDAQLTTSVHTGVEFQPTDAEVGTYTYYVVQEGQCVSAKTPVSFEINALPVVAIYGPTSLYEDEDPATITVSPLGGNLLGSGLSGNMFDPTSVVPGTYNLSYSYSDANGCENSTTHAIQVQERTYADRTQLGDTIARAQSVYNANESSSAYTQAAKTTLNNAIIAAQYYYDNYQSYTDAELLEQTNILSDAIQDFLDSRSSTVDVSALIAKINEAQGVYDDNLANQGTEPGDYPASAFTELDDAISDAQSYVTNPPATQLEVDNQVDVLQDAIDAFYESEIPVPDVVSIDVEESTVNLVVGALFTPVVTFNPDGASGDILWESESSSVASVVAATGVVTAQSKGVTQIKGTLASDPSITVQYVVQVSGVPTVTNIEIADGVGDKLIITFSEQMQAPTGDIYSDLQVVGPNSMLVVTDVALDPNNNMKIIVDLGTVINNPDEIMVVYSGTSLQSIAGSEVAEFERRIDGTSIDAVAGVNVFVYPTIASSQVYVDGVGSAEQISIVTTDGKVIQTVPVTGNTIAIDVTKLAEGTYVVRIDFVSNTVHARFVKE